MRKTAAEIQQTALECLKLRNAGLSYREIASTLNISKSAAHKIVKKALMEITRELKLETRLLLAQEIERLDTIQRSIWNDVLKGNVASVEKAIKVIELRMKAQGLMAPAKIASTDPTGENEATSGVVVVPAPASVDEWLKEYGPKTDDA
ncbi:winged helix-turn-helix transcriptional regulator [Sansalvadorimonas verongulae]|uniref:winged helix-turn-helix transcriptional regulator n=1 Tax=Sansalvadorimonas verongulae TaxID=2172824 RepID=UPI0012BD1DC0|nr:winged helix-turn-helix transcriptional regulator [Sansalvadorimonas verongulae]MTI11998.1 winged helix-turn-helix transcriptional regulator [Sansalvadorimonas verongulae]